MKDGLQAFKSHGEGTAVACRRGNGGGDHVKSAGAISIRVHCNIAARHDIAMWFPSAINNQVSNRWLLWQSRKALEKVQGGCLLGRSSVSCYGF
jgi:hypothetical protein